MQSRFYLFEWLLPPSVPLRHPTKPPPAIFFKLASVGLTWLVNAFGLLPCSYLWTAPPPCLLPLLPLAILVSLLLSGNWCSFCSNHLPTTSHYREHGYQCQRHKCGPTSVLELWEFAVKWRLCPQVPVLFHTLGLYSSHMEMRENGLSGFFVFCFSFSFGWCLIFTQDLSPWQRVSRKGQILVTNSGLC